MRLRHKKTGEIGWLRSTNWNERSLIVMDKDGVQLGKYNSLAELNAEWEDAPEEPKEFWFVNDIGEVEVIKEDGSEETEDAKQIGNYFETKEEAEKAVEKLKAFKRLEDKGFRFVCWNDDYTIDFTINGQNTEPFKINELSRDLCVIFRGEE